MAYTLSWHQAGQDSVRQGHNKRDPEAIGHNSQINPNLSNNNITLVDIPVRQAYKEIFANAVEEYNNRVRTDRKIEDYYTQVYKSNKQTAYEAVVQIGSVGEGTPERAVDALKLYINSWAIRNPNLKLIGAYIHLDESTIHAHLDYIPIAECKRGMRLQNSLTQALKAQGYITANASQTAQMQWQDAERQTMRSICRQMGIQLHKEGKGRDYMSIPEYRQYAESLQVLQAGIDREARALRDLKAKTDKAAAEQEAARAALQKIKTQAAAARTDAEAAQQDVKQRQAELMRLKQNVARNKDHIAAQKTKISELDKRAKHVRDNIRSLENKDAYYYKHIYDILQSYHPDIIDNAEYFAKIEHALGWDPELWPDATLLEIIDNYEEQENWEQEDWEPDL